MLYFVITTTIPPLNLFGVSGKRSYEALEYIPFPLKVRFVLIFNQGHSGFSN